MVISWVGMGSFESRWCDTQHGFQTDDCNKWPDTAPVPKKECTLYRRNDTLLTGGHCTNKCSFVKYSYCGLGLRGAFLSSRVLSLFGSGHN